MTQNATTLTVPVARRHGIRTFLKTFVAEPNVVGAILPSSRFLARKVIKHVLARTNDACVLEVGAGTGAVTFHLADALTERDELHVCEVQPRLADHLETHVLSHKRFEALRRKDRITVHRCAVEDMEPEPRYDYVVCGLPFTAFQPENIREILAVIRSMLKPGGVFTYFEYLAMRRIRAAATLGAERRRMAEVTALLEARIDRHQFDCDAVWRNVPPAIARHWRFDCPAND